MRKAWPMVRLGALLRHRKEFITIDDLTIYKRPRVQLHAQGIILRDEVPGALIKTKGQQVCREGEFLVAEIDAKVGGFGIIPEALDGAIVSSHYFLFEVDESKLDRRFLDYFIRTPAFRDQVEAQGSTNYAAIRPANVLSYESPLPSLKEQQRIVARVEELASHVHDARTLRRTVVEEIKNMLIGAFRQIAKTASRRAMREVAPLVRRPVEVDQTTLYPELGIRSFGNGTFHKPELSGFELGGKRIFKIEPGDLVFSNVFAWEGAIAVAKPEDAGRFGSHRFITCVAKPGEVTARFLCFYFLTKEGLELIQIASPGGAGRNRTLGLEALANIEVPVPSYTLQMWFDSLQAEVERLKRLQAATAAELDALLPAIVDKAFKGEM
jgi:type I restriction enzyme S subunit